MSNNFCENNYWLNIDKPLGYSSAKIVAIVKRITKAKKVGHAGTLDPLASGILPIAINKATKTCSYITDHNKKYRFTISWGEFRDTDDAEGKITEQNNIRPSTIDIIISLPFFIGKIEQTPTNFSAIKINGKKSYEMARNNEEFSLIKRNVEIHQINLISNNDSSAQFEISCSKGTYVRSFARELAQKLGVCGYISSLRRLKVGNFNEDTAISLDKLKNIVNYCCPSDSMLHLRDVLHFMSEVELDDQKAQKVRNGQVIKFSENILQLYGELPVKIIGNGAVIGIGKFSNNNLKPINIF
jgi:tRNA pseudouridine55 synthase